MSDELKAALERLDKLIAELDGHGGNAKVTAQTLKEKILAQANTVTLAYRATRRAA